MRNFFLILLTAISLSSCATHSTNYSIGKPFNTEYIEKIIKGKTTKDELIAFFGQPQIKSVLTETDEKWVYSYTTGTASAQTTFIKTKVNSTGVQKMLDVLMRNGIVINYAYTENQLPVYQSN